MADCDIPMTPADHSMFYALIALTSCRIADPDREELILHALTRAWGQSESANPNVAKLAAVARQVVILIKPGVYNHQRARVLLEASAAVERFAEWRLGLSMAHMQPEVAA
ncbi:hypothetical protein P775_08330 [Puniceibacterium antarcticum]|uniref:Uncharacterized protein n=1 Tax=Puniceibacterium antarcticum TaxID=1206336 RepID=A0A2G8RG04_9RHOB|nr:hypothetical protein [Puniceibacterium antarcticum]PIL20526.1 hypothetical protein P775_08330 [Puniceibacterium antarcticum]